MEYYNKWTKLEKISGVDFYKLIRNLASERAELNKYVVFVTKIT